MAEDDLQTLDEIGRAQQEYGSSVSPYAGLQDYLLQRPVFDRGVRESIQMPQLRALDTPDYTQEDDKRRYEELLALQNQAQTQTFDSALSDLKKTLQEENLASAKAEAGQRSQVTQQLEDQLSTIKSEIEARQKTLEEQGITERKSLRDERQKLLDDLQANIDTAKQELAESQTKVKEAQDKSIGDLKDNQASIVSDLKERMSSLGTDLTSIKTDIQAELDKRDEALTGVQKEAADAIQTEIDTLKDDFVSLGDRFGTETSEQTEVLRGERDQILAGLESKISDLSANITGLPIEDIQSRLDELKADNEVIKDTASERNSAIGEQIEAFKEQLDTASGTQEENLKSAIDALREEMRGSEFAEDVANQVLGFGAIGDEIQGQIPQFLEQALTGVGEERRSDLEALRAEIEDRINREQDTSEDIRGQYQTQIMADTQELLDNLAQQVQQDRGQAIQSALDPLAAQREEAIQRSLAPIAEQRSADIQAALNPAVAGIQEQIEALRGSIPQQQEAIDVEALRRQITDEIMAQMGDRQTTPTPTPTPGPPPSGEPDYRIPRGGGKFRIPRGRGKFGLPRDSEDFTIPVGRGTVPDFVPSPTTIPGPAPRGSGDFTIPVGTGTVPDFVPSPTTIPGPAPRTKDPLDLGGRKTQPQPQFEPTPTTIPGPVFDPSMLGPIVNPEVRIDRERFGGMSPPPPVMPMPRPPIMPRKPTRNLRMRGF